MARFGQGFINSLTQPSYMQGMFTAAQQAGSMPARAREKKEESEFTSVINNAMLDGSSEALANASQLAASRGEREIALKLAQASRQATVARQEKTQGRGMGELIALANNPKFNFEDQKQQGGYFGLAESFGVSRGDAAKIAVEGRENNKSKTGDIKYGAGITEWVDPDTNTVVHRTVQTDNNALPVSLTTGVPVDVSGLQKRINSNSTTVNVGGSETYGDKGLGRLAAIDADAIEQGTAAAANLYTIGQAREVLSKTPEVLGAFGTELVATKRGLLKIMDVFGVSSLDPVYQKLSAQASNVDLINTFTQEFVRTRMDATKGAISDREMKAFVASVPNLLQTPEGYKKVLDYMEKANILTVIRANGLSQAFSTNDVKDNAFKFKRDFAAFTRVFSPNLDIPATELDTLWQAYSENKMSPENITFSFLNPTTGQSTKATFGDLKKQAKDKNLTMDNLINTLFTNFNASVVY